jgi:hypothetical protein
MWQQCVCCFKTLHLLPQTHTPHTPLKHTNTQAHTWRAASTTKVMSLNS